MNNEAMCKMSTAELLRRVANTLTIEQIAELEAAHRRCVYAYDKLISEKLKEALPAPPKAKHKNIEQPSER